MTKGTFYDYKSVSYEPRYVLAVQVQVPSIVSIALLESSTNEIFIGNFRDDERFNIFKRLLTETKPLEVIFSMDGLTEELLHML